MKVKGQLQVPATLNLQTAPTASNEWVSHPGWNTRVLCQPTHISVTIETELWRLNKDCRPVSGNSDSLWTNVDERDLTTLQTLSLTWHRREVPHRVIIE
jgi:hypothetical protein